MVIVILLNVLIAQLSYTYSEAKNNAKLQYAIDRIVIVTRIEYSRFARFVSIFMFLTSFHLHINQCCLPWGLFPGPNTISEKNTDVGIKWLWTTPDCPFNKIMLWDRDQFTRNKIKYFQSGPVKVRTLKNETTKQQPTTLPRGEGWEAKNIPSPASQRIEWGDSNWPPNYTFFCRFYLRKEYKEHSIVCISALTDYQQNWIGCSLILFAV